MVGGAYAPQHRWRRSIQVARLPSHSQRYCSTHERPERYCRTHERPGSWRSFVKSIPEQDGASRNLQGPPASAGSKGLHGPPDASGASKGLLSGASEAFTDRALQGPPDLTALHHENLKRSQELPGASRARGIQAWLHHKLARTGLATSLISTRRLLGLFQPLRTFSVHK